MSSFQFEQIGVIRSPYKEKFAVPRQPGLVKSANGELHLIAPYNQADAVRGLEAFSHLWILFVFHQTMEGGWRPTVRPPRLGGNARMGVFATRSTFRPNPIGMSLVELKEVVCHKDSVILKLGSLDLVDGTPVVDIKPYLPFAESLPDASASYAQSAPAAEMAVSFTAEVEKQLLTLEKRYPQLTLFIREVLAQDPRPAYRKGEETGKTYAVWLHDFNVRWRVTDAGFEVFALEPRFGSLDLVDGTPVVDIKPYLPFAESLPDASASYAQSAPAAEMAVSFTAEVEKQLLTLEKRYPQLTLFIREVLAQDPRPAYRKGEETGKTYAVWLHDFNVRWRVTDAGFEVFALEPR